MSIICFRYLPVLVLSGLLTANPTAQAATAKAAEAPAKPAFTYPQIVRLSYVEGDVRISRGKAAAREDRKHGEPASGWEQASANLPLETGYSLVTGKGRAEIELEDASTVYLGENSVLVLDDLTSTGGVTQTEMALLSGVATVNVRTIAPGERFRLHTATDAILVVYPQKTYLRVNSYLDATALTPQLEQLSLLGVGQYREQRAGETIDYLHGHRILTPQPTTEGAAANKEWDAWVQNRVNSRNEAMAAAMKDAGLTQPVPGLAELQGKGNFFKCEPYGTCWEPADGWRGNAPDAAQEAKPMPQAAAEDMQPATGSIAGATLQETDPAVVSVGQLAQEKHKGSSPQVNGAWASTTANAYLATHPGAILNVEDYALPCTDFAVRQLVARDPVTGREYILQTAFDPFGVMPNWNYNAFGYGYPWDWAVCHTGAWIRWRHHYVWVAGQRRHHHRPIRWVKSGHTVGFVPLHPKDVAGKPPLNLKSGIFTLTGKHSASVQRVDFEEGKPLKVLDEAPREFRAMALEPLHRVDGPHPMAYSIYRTPRAEKGANGVREIRTPGGNVAKSLTLREQGTPITFDRRSQTFMVNRQVTQGQRVSTASQPLGGRFASVPATARGGEGSPMARESSSGAGANRTYRGGGSYSNSGSSSRSSAPSSSGGASARSSGGYSGGSYSGGGGGASAHSGGGYSGGGGGGAHSSGGSGGSAASAGGSSHK